MGKPASILPAQGTNLWHNPIPPNPSQAERLIVLSSNHPPTPALRAFCALAPLLLAPAILAAQDPPPQQAPAVPTLQRIEATDSATGIHYVRLSISLPATANAGLPPRFTVECRDDHGKRDLQWFVGFGGAQDSGFIPPFHRTQTALFPPVYPKVKLKMSYEGYIKWKPVIKGWEALPSGELHYLNPGIGSPNMEPARSFLPFLNSLPGLRIGYARPAKGDPAELFFQTQPLLDEIKKTPDCAAAPYHE
ncbi:MAG: hypothetical protein ABR923_13975 [Terracidiphilus sp.]